jgi:hypothetical protein
MPIPRHRIPVSLTAATPTALTVDALKAQLTDIGLTCPDSEKSKLAAYITEVERELPVGSIQTYQLLKPAQAGEKRLEAFQEDYVESSVGNWEPDSTGFGYATVLEYIQYPAHFDWLYANKPGFTGIKNEPPTYTGRYDSVEAVKQMFATVATDASSTLIKGLDKASIESVLSNAIAPLNDKNAQNYAPGPQSRVIFLVENYNPNTQEADAIGVLTVWWDMTIKDYLEKKKSPRHDTTLTVRCRSVLYASLDAMNADYLAAEAHFKETAFADPAIPRPPATVTIFPSRPPAIEDTFKKSLPKIATENELQAIVLFAPDLQNVGSIDNTNSDTTTTYEKTVTSGFTFSTSQELSVEANFEAGIVIAKGSIKVGLTFTFTEEWSSSTSETMSFSVPGGKKAFTYQGYMMAQILSFDPATARYTYKDTARLLSNVLATSTVPITGLPTLSQPE